MGHQSPNPPQPAQWISATRIRSHPGSSQRHFRSTNCKCEAAPNGPKTCLSLPIASGQVASLTSLSGLRELKQQQQKGKGSLTDLERPSWYKTWWPLPVLCGQRSGLKIIWKASPQKARGVSLAEVEWKWTVTVHWQTTTLPYHPNSV